MGLLARADKRAVSYGVAGSLLLSIGGAFWALPHIEDELDEESLTVESYVAEPGFVVEWNGRDGYLTVPAGTSKADAERVAADLGDIPGTRDVEIRFAEAGGSNTLEDDSDAAQVVPEPSDTTVTTVVQSTVVESTVDSSIVEDVVETPASFIIDWGADGVTQTGAAPDNLRDELVSLGVEEPMTAAATTVGDRVADDLAALAPLIGTSMVSGTATIEEGVLSIAGLAASEDDLAAARSALADIDADATIDLVPSVEGADESDVAADAQAALEELGIRGIQFETNTSVLTAGSEPIIDDVAAVLAAYPTVAIVITGHTDSRGDEVANQLLSEARAAAVLEALVARGIDPQRLESSGVGEDEPIAANDTPAGQQQNRRVEIKIKETN